MLLRDVLRWPSGVVRVLRSRLFGGPPVHRIDECGDISDLPTPVPDADPLVQLVSDGIGDLLHRRYAVVVDDPELAPDALIGRFADDPNCAVPTLAVFRRERGAPGPMAVGDEWRIDMPGPWEGPVRVIGLTPRAVRLATMVGHLEAGQIEFRAALEPSGALRFVIESWARPGDRLSQVFYDRLPLAKEIQLTVWVETCLAMARHAGGTVRDGVAVHTRRTPAAVVARPPAGV